MVVDEQSPAGFAAAEGFNLEETRDFMPQMGPMAGSAVTVVIEPSSPAHKANASAWDDYRREVQLGQLVHADEHGFLAIPPEDEERLLAAAFMDANECRTVIEAARSTSGMPPDAILAGINAAAKKFREAAEREFHRSGEW